MKEILIDEKLPFYKANLHGHTNWSDGKLSPEEIKRIYKEQGYSIIAYTDHEALFDHSDLNDENFLAITSAELAIKENPKESTLKNFKMKVCHLNILSPDPKNTFTPCYSSVYNHYVKDNTRPLLNFKGEYKRRHTVKGINKMIREFNKRGFLVTYNHPSWSLETEKDYIGLEGLWGVEIYNHSVVSGGGKSDEYVFDEMLRAGKAVWCVAADDNHNKREDAFGGYVVINAEKLDYESVFNSLRYGYFYASTGVEIKSLVREDNKVKFVCSDCTKVSLTTEGRRTQAICGSKINEGEFETKEKDGYFRLTFETNDSKTAWTQAYEVEE